MPISTQSLSFNATDYDGDQMNYTVMTSPNIGSSSGTNIANGQFSCNVAGLAYSTTYQWTVNLTDGTFSTQQTFSFTTGPNPYFNPYAEGWQYRKEITINHNQVVAGQTNFPVLIDITDLQLAANAQHNGNDILFMNGAGLSTKLTSEIESYNPTTGQLVAWIDLPSVSSTTDTTFYMYYGNSACPNQQDPTAVWDPNYAMVVHLSETSGTQYDSH